MGGLVLWFYTAVVLAAGLVLAREVLAIWLPWFVATNEVVLGNNEEAARLFEAVIHRRTVFCRSFQQDARYRLAGLQIGAGRYDEAVKTLHDALTGVVNPKLEASYRQRLSEALDGAGRTAEAEVERLRVTELLGESGDTAEALLVLATTHNRMQRYNEAYLVLERALQKLSPISREIRVQTRVQLALTAFNAGRMPETLHWSQEVLASPGADHAARTSAHGIRALALLNLGQLDEAESHLRSALELARAVENEDHAARYLVQLADIVRRRGRINEAQQMCQEARGLTISERRHVYAVEQACLQDKGRFQDALDLFGAMRRSPHYPSPMEQRRMEATQDGFEAQLLTALGRPAEALRLNTAALGRLSDDARLSLQFQADRAWILAALGRREEALEQAAQVGARLSVPEVSRGAQLSAWTSLGRAYLVVDDWNRACEAWTRFLDLQPDPVDVPKAHYFLAQALGAAGRSEEAARRLQSAAEGSPELHYTRLAAKELSGATSHGGSA